MSYTFQDIFTTVPNGYTLVGTGGTVHAPLIGGAYQLIADASTEGSVGQVQSGYAYADNTTQNSNCFICNTVAAATANEVAQMTIELQNIVSAGNSIQIGLLTRCTTTDFYFLGLTFTSGNSSAFGRQYNSGAFTPIGTDVTGITWTAGLYTIFWVPSGSTIAWQIQRNADGLWLQTNGTWASTQVSCVSGTNTALPNAGFTGLRLATIPYGTQIAGVQSISSGVLSGALTAGTQTLNAVSSNSITITTTAATGGTPAYTYTAQIAPDSSGSPGTYTNNGTPTVNQAYAFTGLTAGNYYWVRVNVTDTASGSVYTTAQRVRVLILITPAAIKALGGLGCQKWFQHPTIIGSQATNHSGAPIACSFSSTGNLNVLMTTADTSATHTFRYSEDKVTFTNFSITNAAPNLTILFNQSAAAQTLYLDNILMGGSDWWGSTSTPSWYIFGGIEVDYGCTLSAYSPPLPTKKYLFLVDSYGDSGSAGANVSMGETIMFGLGVFGGMVGIPGIGWYQGALNFPGGAANWFTYYADGVSRLSGGAWLEQVDGIGIILGRNDGVDVTSSVNAGIAALRAVSTSMPIVVSVHPTLCGGYPTPTSLSATTTASAINALISAGDTKLGLITPPSWIADGLDPGSYGLASGATTSFDSSGEPHAIAEYQQKIGAWLAAQFQSQFAALASSSSSSSKPTRRGQLARGR